MEMVECCLNVDFVQGFRHAVGELDELGRELLNYVYDYPLAYFEGLYTGVYLPKVTNAYINGNEEYRCRGMCWEDVVVYHLYVDGGYVPGEEWGSWGIVCVAHDAMDRWGIVFSSGGYCVV